MTFLRKSLIIGLLCGIPAAAAPYHNSPISAPPLRLSQPTLYQSTSGSGESWVAPDKFDHLLVSAMLSGSAFLQMKISHNDADFAFVSSCGFSLTLGAAKEIYDLIHPGHPSWKDLAVDALGSLLGALVASAL
jgi:uncharacterized protein YfiM (DUF2279 family)